MLWEVVRVVAGELELPPVEGVRPQSDPVPVILGTEPHRRLWSHHRPTPTSQVEVQCPLQRSGGCRRKLVGLDEGTLCPVGGGRGDG